LRRQKELVPFERQLVFCFVAASLAPADFIRSFNLIGTIWPTYPVRQLVPSRLLPG
jgi:hypothetical protein